MLRELQDDARLSKSELGRRVGLSPPAVGDRLRRLEDSGVILGYGVELNPRALGYEMAAIVRIRASIGQLTKVAEVASATAQVTECHRVTGEDCYVMSIVFGSISELEELIDRFTPFGHTTTSVVNSTPVPRRGLPVASPPNAPITG